MLLYQEMTNQKEQQLLSGLRRGEQRAVRDWYQHFFSDLLRYALTKVSNHKDAEEIVQETFINCLRHLPLFQGRSSIKTWMIGVMRHEIADYYRKKYAKKALQMVPLAEEILLSSLVDSEEIDLAVRNRAKEVVGWVLKKMSEEKRELLMMKYVDQLKVKELAKKMGKTVKAIESDLFRARKEFRLLYLQAEET